MNFNEQRRAAAAVAATLALTACATTRNQVIPAIGAAGPAGPAAHLAHPASLAPTPIQHVVIIVQENRTVDNLFQKLPGANTQAWGHNKTNGVVKLHAVHLNAPYDPNHFHDPSWMVDYNAGALNGWNLNGCVGKCPGNPSFAYVDPADVQPYYTLAQSYAFADDMFQTNEGPSGPAHQYLVSGTSSVSDGSPDLIAENPQGNGGGCDAPASVLVKVINVNTGDESGKVRPCVTRTSLMTLLDAQGTSWKYYQAGPGTGLWNAPDWLEPIWSSPEFSTNVSYPSSNVLTDIANGDLASVVWVTPVAASSDHPGTNDGSGPSWVASVVNAIGESPYWNSTAIFITWDDWGGWYDHIAPPVRNAYELGFRVPLVVVSPYAVNGYVSHQQHEFGSILKFTEETFELPSLNTTDSLADDLSDCFNYQQAPTPYTPVASAFGPKHFLSQGISNAPLDP
jgi:phospholipase C